MVRSQWLAIGFVALALGLAVNSILGPLATGIIDYHYTETFENQGIGLDAFTLLVAVPLLLTAGVLTIRGHVVGPLLGLGPALMAAYMMPQYVLGSHFLQLPGNNEDFFPLHLGLFVLSVGIALLAWKSVGSADLPETSYRYRWWTGILLFAVAAFLLLRYVPTLAGIWQDDPTDEYLADPIAFWIIAFMDLGIVMPMSVAGGVALLKGVDSALKLMYAVVSWFALVGPSVAAMSYAMELNDDPNASIVDALAFTAFGLIFLGVAIVIFRPLHSASVNNPSTNLSVTP